MELLCFCTCVSLAITALYICIHREGMILHWLLPVLDKHCPAPLQKPLYDCIICMSSIWTAVFDMLLTPQAINVTRSAVSDLGISILIVAGINILICALLEHWTDYGC